MKVAIIGSGGQLGSELCRQFGTSGVGLTRQSLDVTDGPAVLEKLTELRPDAVVNAAAYTAVDRAEDEPQACEAVNLGGVANLAAACQTLDVPLVQVSTDYVFGADRSRSTPYRESDAPGPLSVYGRTKLEGERAAQRLTRHFVVRSCGLYSGEPSKSRNFVTTMLALASRGEAIRVVDDQRCTPTFVPHLAAAIRFLLTTSAYGTYHVTNQGAVTWHDFAQELFRRAGCDVRLSPISTAQYGARAPRPAYSVLDCEKYRALGGPVLPDWSDALDQCLRQREATRRL